MGRECPNCGDEMESHGISRDVWQRGRRVGLDIAWDECPQCHTKIDDFGDVHYPDDEP